MQVILLADVKKVGRKGEVCKVADGYAQNILLPQKLALPATPENVKRFQKEKGRAKDKKAYDESLLIKNIKDLEGKQIEFSVRANDAGKLFQTLHTKQIVEAIEKQHTVSIPENAISMNDIKEIGNHSATLSAGKVKSKLSIEVLRVQ